MAQSPSNLVVATTNKVLTKTLIDIVLDGNTGLTYFLAASKAWNGGRTHQEPIWVTKNTLGGSYYGMDTFAVQELDLNQVAEWDASFYDKPVTLSGVNITLNENTGQQALNLVDISITQAMYSMADDLGTGFYSNGTGNSNKDLLGLGAAVDDGTNVANYAGLSRTTYPDWASPMTASGGTVTLAKMATEYSDASNGGSVHPSLILTTKAGFNFYEQLLQPQLRQLVDVPMIKRGLLMGTGVTTDGLRYRGCPVMQDEKCTTGVMFFINERFMDIAALPDSSLGKKAINFKARIAGDDYSDVKGLGFTWSDWIKAQNGNSATGAVYWGGQLVCNNPRRQSKLTGITGI